VEHLASLSFDAWNYRHINVAWCKLHDNTAEKRNIYYTMGAFSTIKLLFLNKYSSFRSLYILFIIAPTLL